MTEEDALDLLRRAHREPIDEAHFVAVRRRVVSELAARRRRWQRGWAMAFAVTAALLCLAFWPKPARRTPAAASRIASTAPVPKIPAAPAPAVPVVRHVIHASVAVRPRTPVHYTVVGPAVPQPLVVKLITNDPNVVIYWISEKSGE